MSFTIFYNVKPTFQAIKTRSLKNRKIIIFSKGLTHGFGQKKAIFSNFFFWTIEARKMSFTIFQNKETSFQAIKTRSLKRRKIDIFSKGLTHGFWSKNSHLFKIFFQAIQARKMSFTIFWNEKTPFQARKAKKFEKSKNQRIFKLVNSWFWSKNGHFSKIFLGNTGKENVFYDILERKNAFRGFKNKTFKKSKN